MLLPMRVIVANGVDGIRESQRPQAVTLKGYYSN